MKDNSTRYSPGKGIASFSLCGLLGWIWGVTSVPIVAGFAYIVVAPLVFSVGARWWMIHPPIVLVLVASLYLVHRIVARRPVDADEIGKIQCAKDAIYGTIGFGLFYLLAWLGLTLSVTSAAPL